MAFGVSGSSAPCVSVEGAESLIEMSVTSMICAQMELVDSRKDHYKDGESLSYFSSDSLLYDITLTEERQLYAYYYLDDNDDDEPRLVSFG